MKKSSSHSRMSATEQELLMLFEQLESIEAGAQAQRASERFEYRLDSCAVEIQQIGASESHTFMVPTRNLSAGGMAFMHHGFVHTGSQCDAQLVAEGGGWIVVKGEVVGCEYVDNMVHEVRVCFANPISPGQFCKDAPAWTVLIADSDEESLDAAAHHLTVLRASVQRAATGKELVELAQRVLVDCIISDTNLQEMNGLDACRELTEKAVKSYKVAVGDSAEDTDRQAALDAGFDDYRVKPITPEILTEIQTAIQANEED